MSAPANCPLASVLAQRLRDEREQLVHRWLDRIADRVALSPNQIFPTEELLDHIPLLIDGIADYLEHPVEEITTDVPVIAKAMELGELRHEQGSTAHQVLREFEILGGVLFTYLSRIADEIDEPCTRGELLACAQRVFRAIAVIQQFCTDHFLRRAEERVQHREEQLRRFSRSVSHELKNRIGAANGALSMLHDDWFVEDEGKRKRFLSIASRNVSAMAETLDGLIELARLDVGRPVTRNTLLPDAAAEVKRQLRDFAEARGVKVELSDSLPWVEVPAAAVELALSNYISNAVKYRDPAKNLHWVQVDGEVRQGAGKAELVVRVRDNGLGVPEEARSKLFERFFRAHAGTATDEEGSGLGLSLVREMIESVGGRTWAEFPKEGAVFAFSLPAPGG
ncbi:MAG TPA: sensor histidine kinase [Longimicrobiaceae bacterium]|jgi:signal transduction histidine kinase|nr:sensor histidine kinase [Longimicrobiaceae bacterium]